MTIDSFLYCYGFILDEKIVNSMAKQNGVDQLFHYLEKNYKGLDVIHIPHDIESDFNEDKEKIDEKHKDEGDESEEQNQTGKCIIGKIVDTIETGLFGKKRVKLEQLSLKKQEELNVILLKFIKDHNLKIDYEHIEYIMITNDCNCCS